MDKSEAKAVVSAELGKFRALSYAELVERLLDQEENLEVTGPSGARYAIEIHGFWDDPPGGNFRVAGLIDDGGWRAFVPLTDDFIVAPDGSFVDKG
jgi:hypothetical protein